MSKVPENCSALFTEDIRIHSHSSLLEQTQNNSVNSSPNSQSQTIFCQLHGSLSLHGSTSVPRFIQRYNSADVYKPSFKADR
ncbi:hypothetical protein CEXT_219401 [Caerostris extrusa]|uniref:Uncharacterized protein n=1 Tax=Caerostris extrusa TaxID=172846 RepID=A0AAV4WLP4_CAEEX|nr:hypothetical protein CEXT_219401 [Caerostris extrusa]